VSISVSSGKSCGEAITKPRRKAMTATNCPEADKYIRPEYHNGWAL